MALSQLSTTLRNRAVDAYMGAINLGSTNTGGKIQVRTAGDVLLCVFDLPNPAFPSASSGSASANGLPISDTNAAGSGTASYYEVLDRDDNVCYRGQVSGELTLSNTTITAGDTVNLTAWTHTHPTG